MTFSQACNIAWSIWWRWFLFSFVSSFVGAFLLALAYRGHTDPVVYWVVLFVLNFLSLAVACQQAKVTRA